MISNVAIKPRGKKSKSKSLVHYDYNEAFKKCVEYFDGDDLAAKVFLDKYALRDNDQNLLEETPVDMHKRIAKEFARIEKNKFKDPLTYQQIFDCLDHFKRIVPQGSPMYGIGNKYQIVTLSNCYVIDSPIDSYSGIMHTDMQLVNISKRRGGVGLDLSHLRPEGSLTHNAARTSTGIIPFLERYSNSIREVGQCLHSSTRILTKHGLCCISEISKGDEVWTENGWVVVTKNIKNKKDTIKIRTKSGLEIICSKDHVVYTPIGEKKAGELNQGDSVVRIAGFEWYGEDIYLNTSEYKKNKHNNSNRLNNTVIQPKILNSDLAYLLGYSYGDGYVEKRHEYFFGMELACSNDWPDIIEKLQNILKKEYNIHVDPSNRAQRGDMQSLRFHSRILIDHLNKNNLLKTHAGTLIFPDILMKAKTNVVFAFIAGYFDADGSVIKSKKVYRFSSIDRDFLSCIQQILLSHGILSNLQETKRGNGWRNIYSLVINGRRSQDRFKELCIESIKVQSTTWVPKIRDFSRTIYSTQHYGTRASLHDYIIDDNQKITYSTSQRLCNDLSLDNCFFLLEDKVDCIKTYEENSIVYDLCLEHTHYFSANGIYVHNSGRRGALMVTLSVHHPEILKFASVKSDLTKVTGANISIRLTNEFLLAVEKNKDVELRWPVDAREKGEEPKVSNMINARSIWNEIVKNARNVAEPGLLFWDNIIKESPADCYAKYGFRSISTNPCVTADTWILTADGPVLVKNLVGKQFYALVKNEACITDIRGFYSTGVKPILRIMTVDGYSLKCTPNHLIRVVDIVNRQRVCSWKEAGNLCIGDKVSLSNHRGVEWRGKGSYQQGWLLGSLLGDGVFIKSSTQLSYWGENKEAMHAVALSFMGSVKCRSDCGTYTTNTVTFQKQDRLNLGSVGIKKLADEFGVTPDKNLLDKCEMTSSDFQRGLLSGWFDADGTVLKDNEKCSYSIRLGSIKLDNLYRAQKMLARLGIISHVYKNRKEEGFRMLTDGHGKLKEYWCQAYHELTIGKDNVYIFADVIGFEDKLKQAKLDEILRSYNRGPYKDNFCSEVMSVEYCGEEEVFDCTVLSAHEFDANGIEVHNCSEIILNSHDSCRLLLLNLFGYIVNPFLDNAYFNYDAFYEDAKMAQRLMDDMIDLELEKIDQIIKKIKKDPEPIEIKKDELSLWKKIKQKCIEGRRTGTGITALGDTLAALKIQYGSQDGLGVVDKIYKTLKLACYRSSVDMAKELGPFPIWDYELEKNNPFLLRIKEDDNALYEDMKKYGRRNIALLTTPPAGSVSILTQTTSGIEPLFMASYTRRKKITPSDKNARVDFVDPTGDRWQEFVVYHPRVKQWIEITGNTNIEQSPWHKCCAEDLDWKMRVKYQSTATRHIDHSISSTLNLPEDVTTEQVAEIYETAWKEGVKGITVYRKNCRSGVLIENKKDKPQENTSNQAPKRPKGLPCDVHHVTVKGEQYFVLVGKMDDRPYEVFAGRNGTLNKKTRTGIITKIKRGQYRCIFEDGTEMDNVAEFITEDQEALTRLSSTSLRHGVDIGFIVHQLEKVKGDMQSFAKSMSRSLKRYIADGSKVHGEECPNCGSSNIVRQQGCCTCMNCAWSKCS